MKKKAEQERLNLYRVDMKYIRDLHRADDRVSSVSPQIGKDKRVYVGILVVCKDKKYVVPLSHAENKHKNMKTSADFDKVYDKKNRLVAVLNFNLMIPVTEKQLIPVDLSIHPADSPSEKAYKNLCINEIEYCRKPAFSKIITDKANTLYDLCKKESGYKGKSRCLDFEKLEKICERFNQKFIQKQEEKSRSKKQS